MSTLTGMLEHDPHVGKPIPGQSFTSAPGSMPYEQPPLTDSVEESILALKAGLYQRKNQREIGQFTRAGISCETLAGSMVMMAFMKGMFNPDIAELIKPFLAVEIFKIAKDQGVDQVILENKPIEKNMDINALEELKQEAMPDNTINVDLPPEIQSAINGEKDILQENAQMPMLDEGFISKPKEVAEDVI